MHKFGEEKFATCRNGVWPEERTSPTLDWSWNKTSLNYDV